MTYLLFTISYLVDLVLLILLIVLIIGVFQLLRTIDQEYNSIEKLKIAPGLITKNPRNSFEQLAAKNKDGTYLTSFHKHKSFNKFVRHLIVGTLGFLGLKLVIVSLIFLQIPRLSEAQSKFYNALYQANTYNNFSKGKFTLTQWDNNSVDLQPGQLDGNYISVPIGDGVSNNQWKNLSYKTDMIYGLASSLPNTIATWQLDSLDKCTDSKYSCNGQGVNLTEGLYGSNAYHFDGEKSLVKIDQNVSPTGSFTIAAWIKPDQMILNGSEDQNYVIFAKGYGDYTAKPPYAYKYQLFFGFKNGALSLIYWPDNNQAHWVMAQNNKYSFSADLWYNVTGVYDDKNKTIKLYIDGIEQFNILADYDDKSTNSLNSKVHLSPNLKDNLPSWIGGTAFKWMDGQEKPSNVFKGTIDHVILSNSVPAFADIKNMITSSGNISFQIRTGNTLPLSGPFYGPKGDPTAFFKNPTSNDLSFVADSKYLQYICFINRPNTNFNPKLTNIFVDYTTSSEPNLISASSTNISNPATLTRDPAKEKEATDLFYQFFKVNPKTAADQQFIDTLAYGQVQSRDLITEQKALTAFVKHYKRMPASDLDWRIIKALAYTDKGAILMKSWLGLK